MTSHQRLHWLLLVAGLVGLSGLIQVFVLARAVSPELDSVRFIETARAIEREGLVTALRGTAEQPLFPMAIWLTHAALERMVGESRSIWVVSAQVAAAIPLVLTIVPVYFLSVRLVGRRAALAGTLLFCVLPEVSCLGAEGISDSTHLLFFCLALWTVTIYLTGTTQDGPCPDAADRSTSSCPPSSPRWLLLAGLATGTALLARVEAIVLPFALVVTLGVLQLRAKHRQPWSRPVAAAAYLVLGIGLVFGPYLVVVQANTPRVAVARLLGRNAAERSSRPEPPGTSSNLLHAASWQLPDGEPMSFVYKDPSIRVRRRGPAAVKLYFEELADAFGYWIAPFALLGLWRLRRVFGRPIDWFDLLFLLLFGLATAWFVSREGYLCARHLLPTMVVGIGCGGLGLLTAGGWLGQRLNGLGSVRLAPLLRPALPWAAVAAAGLPCVVESARPVNAVRLCHRQAAEWLAHQAPVPGQVLDTWGLTGLYSGRRTYAFTEAPAVLGDPRLTYVVLESRELEYATSRSRTLRTLLEAAAEPVARFTSRLSVRGHRTVVVYRWHADRFAEWALAGFSGRRDFSEPVSKPAPNRSNAEVHPVLKQVLRR